MGATARCILFMIAASSGASFGAAVDVEGVLVDAKLALATASPIDSLRKKGGEGACCVLSMLSETSSGLKKLKESTPPSDKKAMDALVRSAGLCCRRSLCKAIRSEKSCKSVSTCTWIGGRSGKAVSRDEDEEDASPCVSAASQDGTVERTVHMMEGVLKKLEEAEQRSSGRNEGALDGGSGKKEGAQGGGDRSEGAQGREDAELRKMEAEERVREKALRLTDEAQDLFKAGDYSGAQAALDKALAEDARNRSTGRSWVGSSASITLAFVAIISAGLFLGWLGGCVSSRREGGGSGIELGNRMGERGGYVSLTAHSTAVL